MLMIESTLFTNPLCTPLKEEISKMIAIKIDLLFNPYDLLTHRKLVWTSKKLMCLSINMYTPIDIMKVCGKQRFFIKQSVIPPN